MAIRLIGVPDEWKRPQKRMSCPYCRAEWWITWRVGGQIDMYDRTEENAKNGVDI